MKTLPPRLARRMFRDMLRIRLIEERIAELYQEQEMRCPVHLCIGQEATPVGVCAHLTKRDYVMSGHRSHGHYLAKGADLPAMMAELYGKVTGCCSGNGGSMHLIDLECGFLGATPIVAATIPIAVGAAFASVMKEEARVVVVFFGEGATEEGAFHESVNFAVLKKLPVVFVCENNLYSVYSPLEVRQPEGREVFAQATAYGLPSAQGDGNDVGEVFEMAGAAIARARRGEGPSFIELKTYRWREHCGPNFDNDLGYRTVAEYERWRVFCPIAQTARHLRAGNVLSDADVAAMTAEINAEIDAAVRFAKESPYPGVELLTANEYASREVIQA